MAMSLLFPSAGACGSAAQHGAAARPPRRRRSRSRHRAPRPRSRPASACDPDRGARRLERIEPLRQEGGRRRRSGRHRCRRSRAPGCRPRSPPRARRAAPRACRRPSARRSRPDRCGRLPGGRQPVRLHLRGGPPQQAPQLAGVRGEDRRRGTLRRHARAPPASAFRPSASITSGRSTALGRLPRSAKDASSRPSPGPSTTESARSAASIDRRRPPPRVSEAVLVGQRHAHHLGQLHLEDRRSGRPARRRAPIRRPPASLPSRSGRRRRSGPVEPPTTSTAPELNFVELAPRGTEPRERPCADQARRSAASAPRPTPRGCRCPPPRPGRHAPCPGAPRARPSTRGR